MLNTKKLHLYLAEMQLVKNKLSITALGIVKKSCAFKNIKACSLNIKAQENSD